MSRHPEKLNSQGAAYVPQQEQKAQVLSQWYAK